MPALMVWVLLRGILASLNLVTLVRKVSLVKLRPVHYRVVLVKQLGEVIAMIAAVLCNRMEKVHYERYGLLYEKVCECGMECCCLDPVSHVFYT